MINNKYEFMILFDVKDGNPNGDPDSGNMPRIDPITGQGIVSDVCLKRKIRNYVEMVKEDKRPNAIYIKERSILNTRIDEAYQEAVDDDTTGYDRVSQAREWMCANYWDIRTFGALMTSGNNAGQVRGPIQMTFARSIDPIMIVDNCLTRCAVATEQESERQKGENRTIARKFTVPYALYVSYGYISANLANKSGFTDQDLELFWSGLVNMFEDDRSSSRGQMSVRKVIVFKHTSKFGNAPAAQLFDLIEISRDGDLPANRFKDYKVEIDRTALPKGVKIIEKV